MRYWAACVWGSVLVCLAFGGIARADSGLPAECAGATELPPTSAPARFALSTDGTLELVGPKTSAWTFKFTGDLGSGAFVRITSVRDGAMSWCARVDESHVYQIAKPPPDGDTLVVALYTAQQQVPSVVAPERAKVLVAAQSAERDAVHRIFGLQLFADELADAQQLAEQDAQSTTFDDAIAAGELARRELADARTTWECAQLTADDELAPVPCQEIAAVANNVDRALAIIRRVAASLPAPPPPTPKRGIDNTTKTDTSAAAATGKAPAVKSSQQPIATALTDAALDKDYYEALPAIINSISPEPAPGSDARANQCKRLGELAWMKSKGPFLAARASIPVLPSNRLAIVRYGTAPRALAGADLTQAWGLIVTAVPTGTKLAFTSIVGKPVSVEPSTLISTVLHFALPQVPANQLQDIARQAHERLHTLESLPVSLLCEDQSASAWASSSVAAPFKQQLTSGKAKGGSENALLDAQERDGQAFQDFLDDIEALSKAEAEVKAEPRNASARRELETAVQTSAMSVQALRADGISSDRVVDPAVPPFGAFETESQIFTDLDPKHQVDLVACTGDSCTAVDDKDVHGRVTITPSRKGSLTLLVEATVGFGVRSKYGWPWDPGRTTFTLQNAPTFDPADVGDGPDQLFQLEQRVDPRNAVSTGLIIGCYFKDKWLVGGGPALLVGTAGGAFTQWDVRFARSIGKGVFVTFGPSLRFLPVYTDYGLDQQVSVTKSSTGTAAAPTGRTYYSPELQFDVGFGIDIGTLGSAAADTIKSFGGKS